MQVQIPIFILCLLVHTGLFLTSANGDRRLRFMAGLAILFNTWPAWYTGLLLAASPEIAWQWSGKVLSLAPYYLPLLSFLVYIRTRENRQG